MGGNFDNIGSLSPDSKYLCNYFKKVYIKNSEDKGRGIFAQEDIEKG